jgi:hypothetical protein
MKVVDIYKMHVTSCTAFAQNSLFWIKSCRATEEISKTLVYDTKLIRLIPEEILAHLFAVKASNLTYYNTLLQLFPMESVFQTHMIALPNVISIALVRPCARARAHTHTHKQCVNKIDPSNTIRKRTLVRHSCV